MIRMRPSIARGPMTSGNPGVICGIVRMVQQNGRISHGLYGVSPSVLKLTTALYHLLLPRPGPLSKNIPHQQLDSEPVVTLPYQR